MLLTDAQTLTLAALQNVDPEVGDVVTAEGITLTGTGNLFDEILSECQADLLAALQRFGNWQAYNGVSANHTSAVMNVGGPALNRTRAIPNQLVVTLPGFPQVDTLRRWILYRALYIIYRAASNRTIQDRYIIKMTRYAEEARKRYWPSLRNNGIPLVYRALSAPGALYERLAGIWGSSNVTTVTAGGATGGTFQVAITWVDQSQYLSARSNGNAESAPAAIVSQVVASGHALSVNLTGLTPPTGLPDPAYVNICLTSPLKATGWNLYVGGATGNLYLQNATPIPIATTTYSLSADPVLSGSIAGFGQYPDGLFTIQDTLQRA